MRKFTNNSNPQASIYLLPKKRLFEAVIVMIAFFVPFFGLCGRALDPPPDG